MWDQVWLLLVSLLDAQRALVLLEGYQTQLQRSEDQQLRRSIQRVIGIFQSNLFQALIGELLPVHPGQLGPLTGPGLGWGPVQSEKASRSSLIHVACRYPGVLRGHPAGPAQVGRQVQGGPQPSSHHPVGPVQPPGPPGLRRAPQLQHQHTGEPAATHTHTNTHQPSASTLPFQTRPLVVMVTTLFSLHV